MNKVVILIISHKVLLNDYELISLKQCYKILGKHPIRFICPENLDVSLYKKELPNPIFDFIDPKWQSSYSNFNLLKLNLLLYERYKNYEYILFYEPDAYVFSDELEYWCNKGYDYIGAPIPLAHVKMMQDRFRQMLSVYNLVFPDYVGNGGFSLRKVKTHLDILLSKEHLPQELILNGISNEDIILNILLYNQSYYLPTIQESEFFSFELLPTETYTRTRKLPMGCHGWYKTKEKLYFWQKWIMPKEYYKRKIKNWVKLLINR